MADYELQKGVALVLVGPEGSGKTRLAFEIAQRYGKVRSISGFGLNNPVGLRRALRAHPDVLIIDQVPDTKALRQQSRVPDEIRALPGGFREAARICRDRTLGPATHDQ